MQNQLFRKKSLERVSSPEQLNNYMRVTSPAVWMLLGVVIALLAGLLVLSSVNRLETLLPVQARVSDGSATVVVSGAQGASVREGQPLRVAGVEVALETVYLNDAGDTVCTAPLSAADGTYDAQIVTDSVSPIRFLLN